MRRAASRGSRSSRAGPCGAFGRSRASSSPPAAFPGTPNCGPNAIRSPPVPGPWRPKATGAKASAWRATDGTSEGNPDKVWDRAKPGMIAVNRRVERLVNESASYHEFISVMYRGEPAPEILAYLIFDHAFIETWGLGLALPGGPPRRHLIDDGYLVRAATLPDLAARLGIDPQRLAATVERYNSS